MILEESAGDSAENGRGKCGPSNVSLKLARHSPLFERFFRRLRIHGFELEREKGEKEGAARSRRSPYAISDRGTAVKGEENLLSVEQRTAVNSRRLRATTESRVMHVKCKDAFTADARSLARARARTHVH